MLILLSNDDGYTAPGLRSLMGAMRERGEISVVAPDRNRSGASNSLTLHSPLRVHQHDDGVYSLDGTPTDCVHLGITGLLAQEPDMVVSGINAGANMGDDVLYSGTVAAAMEGRFLGLPAIAVSSVAAEPQHYATAAHVTGLIIDRLANDPLPADTILNVNVPDIPWKDIKGFRATRLGFRHKSAPVIKDKDPRGRTIYWIGPAGAAQDATEGTDFHAVLEDFVSITPLHVDLTRYTAIDQVSGWVQGL